MNLDRNKPNEQSTDLRESQAAKSPLKKGAKAVGLGGCPDAFANRTNDNPRAVSLKPLSPFVKGDLTEPVDAGCT